MSEGKHLTERQKGASAKQRPKWNYVRERQAQGKVKTIYEDLKNKRGSIPKLYMALANDPDFLEAYYNKRNTVMRPGKIDLATKEAIAFAVSVVHNCRQ